MKLKEWCEFNGYILSNELPKELYRYGDGNISVTTILSIIKDPGFDYVLNNHKEAVDKACVQGTKVHKEAEDFHTKGSGVKTINKNFMIFHTLTGIESIYQEKTFYKDGVRGTVDSIGYNDIDYYNIDYKNSKIHSPKYCLQLGGYEWLNGNKGVLVYGKGKLKVIYIESYYKDLFIQLKDYFFNLLNTKTKGQLK